MNRRKGPSTTDQKRIKKNFLYEPMERMSQKLQKLTGTHTHRKDRSAPETIFLVRLTLRLDCLSWTIEKNVLDSCLSVSVQAILESRPTHSERFWAKILPLCLLRSDIGIEL